MEPTTRILEELASGDPTAADRLLPLVYDELRQLAARSTITEVEWDFVAGTGRRIR